MSRAANHVDPGNACVRAFGVGSRQGHGGRRSPTMVVSGAATSTPLIARAAGSAGGGAYAAMLARELPKEAPPGTGWRLASFFCCAGGIDLGFRSAGVEPAFANDIDKDAVAAYEANLGHAPLHRDIREVGRADYPTGEVDVVAGGFPCVTFSTAGKRLGVVDDLHGKLYLELCRVIGEIRPRYFVAENVRGILSANGGAAVRLVAAAFLRLGYRTAYELVNMAEHGVPQTRERVVFVGVREDQWRGTFRFPRPTRRLLGDKRAPAWLPPATTLREAIGDLPPPGERLIGMMHGDAAAKRARGNAGVSAYQSSRPRAAASPAHSQTTSANVLIVGGHEPNDSPVSAPHNMSRRVARGGRRPPTAVSEAANVQPFVDGLRRMTVRECARVQSFPDWFGFPGSQAAGYKLVGNAVPPLYAKRLAAALLEYDRREAVR